MLGMEEIYGTNVLSKDIISGRTLLQLCSYRTTALIKIDSERSRGLAVEAKSMSAHKTSARGNSA